MVNFNPSNPDDWRKQFESIVSQQKDSDLDALNEKLRRSAITECHAAFDLFH